jgi:hypothetical protein
LVAVRSTLGMANSLKKMEEGRWLVPPLLRTTEASSGR